MESQDNNNKEENTQKVVSENQNTPIEEKKNETEITSNSQVQPKEKEEVIEFKSEIRRTLSINAKSEHLFKVYNPITKEGIKNYTLYTVECSLTKNVIYKRYSDFDNLRQKLAERWPGIYIPNVPHKKIVGNLETSFIELRCRQLDTFSNKLCKMPYLFFSDEVKYFLTSDDVEKALNKLPKENYDELLMKYKKQFVNIIKEGSNQNIEDDINKCTNFMTKVLVKTLTTLKVSQFEI